MTRNLFGRLYTAGIDAIHRRYIAPGLLRMAVDHAITSGLAKPAPTFGRTSLTAN